MGKPKTIVHGDITMRLSTEGELVDSLMPRKDLQSLVRVFGEVSQNVMDWAFEEGKKKLTSAQVDGRIFMKKLSFI